MTFNKLQKIWLGRKFRNELAHGTLNVSGLDLKPINNDLKELQNRIENI